MEQWTAIDVLAAVVVVLAAWFNLHPPQGEAVRPPHGTVQASLVVVAVGAMVLRRRWPRTVLAITTAATAALTAIGRSPFVLDVPIMLAAYTAAVSMVRRRSVPVIIVAEAALLAGVITAMVIDTAGNDSIHSLLAAAAAWFVGDAKRVRNDYVAGLVEQADQRRLTEVQRERQAVRAERVRIARELHDVVAHSLTVMTVQAGVGLRVMDRRPAETRRSLEAIEATGRTAQDELRLVVGLLREDEADREELAPAPGLKDLAELVETVRAAGITVELSLSGPTGQISPAMELSVYRVVQEALTNVVKHAPGARACVDLACSEREVRMEIADDGGLTGATPPSTAPPSTAPPSAPGGQEFKHGVLGMRERVAAFGGSLSAQRRPESGFLVVARLPVQGAS